MPALYESDQVMKIPAYGDKIINIQSKEAPFLKLLPRGPSPERMLCSWPVENYPVRGIAGQIDGTDKTSFSSASPTEIEAYAQWCLSDGWMVGKLAALTKTAGTPAKSQKARQVMVDGAAFGLQLNRLLLSNQELAAETKPSQAYQLRGAFQWLSRDAQAVKPVDSSFRPASACAYTSTLAAYSSDDMIGQLEAAYAAKRGPVDLTHFVGVALKGQMSTWAQKLAVSGEVALQMFNQDASSKKIIQTVDVFEFDAGMVRNILTPDLRCDLTTGLTTAYSTRSGLGLDMSMWEVCWLEEITPYEEAPKSGGPRGYHSAVMVLKCKNPLGQILEEISS